MSEMLSCPVAAPAHCEGALTALIRRGLLQLTPQTQHSNALADSNETLTRSRRQPHVNERAWIELANRLGLTNLEVLGGQLALLAEVDAPIVECLQSLQGARGIAGPQRPTLGLIIRLWTLLEPDDAGREARLLATLLGGVAASCGALKIARDETIAIHKTLAVHGSLLGMLFGAVPCEFGRVNFDAVAVSSVDGPDWMLPASWYPTVTTLAGQVRDGADSIVCIRCADVADACQLAAILAEQAELTLVEVIGLTDIVPPSLEPWLLASGRTPLIVADLGPGEQLKLPRWNHYRGPQLVAASLDGEVRCEQGMLHEWRPAPPTPHERVELLATLLPVNEELCRKFAMRWRASVGALNRVAAQLTKGLAQDGTIDEECLSIVLIREARRAVQAFGELAQSVRIDIVDDALVTSAALQLELDLLLTRCRHRETLMDSLGVAVQARAHPGVKALLTGASGTGKTLAAQWLAHRLGKPLLRVDAANVMSKYIGETEKNLARLLAQGEHIDCILLFDEADAIFGSRTEVKQSNDRFANAQTNYLLTRLESFDGVAILTSNSKARFDDAFVRRLDAVIEFPLPSGQQRRELWLAHLGAHRLGENTINRLAAEVDLPGGHIRNVVIGAALLARARGADEITMHDIRAALSSEYAKLGRRLPEGLAARTAAD